MRETYTGWLLSLLSRLLFSTSATNQAELLSLILGRLSFALLKSFPKGLLATHVQGTTAIEMQLNE